MHRLLISLLGLALLVVGSRSFAAPTGADWPRFRGPGGLGQSAATGLPLTWSLTENMAWAVPLPGPGTSSPVVVGDRIYLTCYTGFQVPGDVGGAMEDLKLHVVCLNLSDGSTRWTTPVTPSLPEQERIREDHGYASSTPVCDGERLYVFFGKTGVFAFDLEGKQLWQADVGSQLSGWGSAASPVLWDPLLIVNASVESECLVALDKTNGEERWRTGDIKEAWNTPLLVPVKDGDPPVELVVGMPKTLMGLNPATGETLWRCDNDIGWYIAPSAVAHEGMIWSIGGRSGTAAVAVRAGGRGDVTATHRMWTSGKGSNVSSPVYHDGYLYWAHDNLGIAYCADAKTGELKYEERLPRAGQVYASPVVAEGRVYYISRSGRCFVVAARPEYELLAANDLSDLSTFNASPAVAGQRLLIRSDKHLYCIGR